MRILFIILIFFMSSCSPKMHLIGVGMRKFNMSQNKYTPNKPYIKNTKN